MNPASPATIDLYDEDVDDSVIGSRDWMKSESIVSKRAQRTVIVVPDPVHSTPTTTKSDGAVGTDIVDVPSIREVEHSPNTIRNGPDLRFQDFRKGAWAKKILFTENLTSKEKKDPNRGWDGAGYSPA
ncbi:hypothetical protein FSP39_022626 [Pinctada imbricata]|uniref:Uncharacterized protein n=1 Tax=Pinctada imbricata TaxID=66713 RepID=A0AA88YPJ9_PINIB|nr:hypothetical protein FSP39_022626 [Pinctada imbricata]